MKKLLSLFLALALALSAAAGGYAVSADAVGETITYSFMIKTNTSPAAFAGTLYYPDSSLKINNVSDVTVLGDGWPNDIGGEILFNSTTLDPYDFSEYTAIVTVVFEVMGKYDSSDVYVDLDEMYSIEGNHLTLGNIPYYYKNVIDGERVSSGYTDIDNASNNVKDPDNISYTVVYTYADSPSSTATRTKTVSSPSENADTVAEFGVPSIENPYYNYSFGSAFFTGERTIAATLATTDKKYKITYNDVTYERSYLQSFTAKSDEEKDFLIDGEVVATGSEYSFYVTTDTTIITEDSTGDISDSASLLRNALAITDNPDNQDDVLVKMEFLATVKSNDFARMGVAFALSDKSENEIKAAVANVQNGSSVYNKISVYNSAVDSPNKSGQYQFIYAPYASATKLSADKTLYFYAFGVDKQGEVKVSGVKTVNISNVLA